MTTADPGWTEERIELIKRTIVPRGIPTDEFVLFIEQCKRSGLDPLLKQAFCVPREVKGAKLKDANGRDKMEQWNDGSWHPVYEKFVRYEFQPSRDGMLVRANRFPDFLGLQASEVYAEDDIIITYAEDGALSSVRHSFNPAKRKGALVGAWAKVARQGKLPVLVWADFAAFVQKSPLWKEKPAVMICKVAEAMALRKSYPEAFGGLYIAGERSDDSETDTTDEPTPHEDDSPIARVVKRVINELPYETATRQSTPVLEMVPEKEPVTIAASVEHVADETELAADAIIAEAEAVVTAAIESGRSESSLKQARSDLSALGARARKLPKGTPARARVGTALEMIHAQLFGSKQ